METRARYILVGLFALVAIAAGFAFVYWLNNTSGLGKRDVYQIRFLGAVSDCRLARQFSTTAFVSARLRV